MTTYNFSVLRGNTFNGAQFTVSVNGTPLDLTGASIVMDFRSDPNSSILQLSLALGTGLTLITPAAGIFKLDAQIFPLLPGVYFYDMLITLPNGTKKTYISGTCTIAEDVTWT